VRAREDGTLEGAAARRRLPPLIGTPPPSPSPLRDMPTESTPSKLPRTLCLDSLRGSSVKIGTIQRRLAWPLRKDDTHKSRSVNSCLLNWGVAAHANMR